MEDLSTGHQLMLYAFNKYQTDFIPTSLYLRWQVTFQTLFITVKVMQVRDPTASLYICQLGSQPAENLFSITRTLNHNRNFDVLQLQDRLQAVLDIQDIFLAHLDWRKRHQRYATDRLTPLEYTADCSVQSVDLEKVLERGTARATTILEQHPQIGSSAHNVLESLYQGGATLLKPCGAPLVLDKEDEFLGTAPDTKGMEDSDPTDACSLESWLRCHGSDRNRAYVPCANGHTVHIAQLVNEYFNGNVEHASTDRLRRTAQTARFGQTPTNVNNVALPCIDNCNFDEDAVTVGAIFLALVTFIWGSQRTCSVGTFSFSWCTVDGARDGTTKEALATGHAIPVTGQFLPFVGMTSDPTLLRWTGWFGPECEFRNGHVAFLDAQMDADGRWLVPVGTLSAFVKTAKVPNCPRLRAEPYVGVAHTSVRPTEATELFVLWSSHCFGKDASSCGSALAERRGGNGPKDAW